MKEVSQIKGVCPRKWAWSQNFTALIFFWKPLSSKSGSLATLGCLIKSDLRIFFSLGNLIVVDRPIMYVDLIIIMQIMFNDM